MNADDKITVSESRLIRRRVQVTMVSFRGQRESEALAIAAVRIGNGAESVLTLQRLTRAEPARAGGTLRVHLSRAAHGTPSNDTASSSPGEYPSVTYTVCVVGSKANELGPWPT